MSSIFSEFISPTEAVALQKELQKQVVLCPLEKEIKVIAGTDVSFNKYSNIIYAGIVVLEYPSLKIIEERTSITTTTFPYIPGLLAFRELPPLLETWDQLINKPDVLITDGHGIAHPRRLGIATSFGLLVDIPAFGCAKKVLTGKYDLPDNERFSERPLLDNGEKIGTVLRSKQNCKPIFVSAGYKITQEESIEITRNCLTKYRIPEPTRLAHLLVNKIRMNN